MREPRWPFSFRQTKSTEYLWRVARPLRSLAVSVFHGETAIWPSIACGATVAAASYLVGNNRGNLSVDVALASMATFLFGVLLAFTIARTRERLALVQNLISKGNASLLSIHQLVGVFSESERLAIRDLIDRHLTDQIDYRLVDNYRSAASHQALVVAVYALNPTTSQQEVVYKEAIAICISMGSDRALIEATTGQALSPIEWTGMLLLLLLLIGLITVLPGGTILGALVAGLLSGTLVTLMILLRKLDLLRWHERVALWEPATRLFRSMGTDPYVPRHVIEEGRYLPQGRIRVVDYPDRYPDRTTKIVTVVDLGEVDLSTRTAGSPVGAKGFEQG
jgi:hypothetical protein